MLRKIAASYLTIALVFTMAPVEPAFSQVYNSQAYDPYNVETEQQGQPQDQGQVEGQGEATGETEPQEQPEDQGQDQGDTQAQEEPKPQESEVKAKYMGTPNSMRYHYPYCPYAQQTPAASRVKFKSAKEAQRAGYMACNLCTPLITD